MSRHTSGPWSWEQACNGGGNPIPRSYEITAGETVDGEPVAVAEFYRREDARLGAAAPDMLAALQAAQEHIGMVRIERGFDIEPIREQVAAAIAKATGSQP